MVANFGVSPSMSPTLPLLAANQTPFSSNGAIARILKLSVKTREMATSVKVLSVSEEHEKSSTVAMQMIRIRIIKCFRKSNQYEGIVVPLPPI